jgi:hypothetical protein
LIPWRSRYEKIADSFVLSVILAVNHLARMGNGSLRMVLLGENDYYLRQAAAYLTAIARKGHQKKKAAPKVVQSVEAAPVTVSKTNDEEIVAAIAAAIAMAESESDGIKFRVVSFKRR